MMQEQSKDLKAEVVSSQLSMKQEMKEQMDEFFTKLMKVQTSTPPSQPLSLESMASNIAHAADTTPQLGDTSPAIQMFKLSASPQSQIAPPKTNASTSYRQTMPQMTSLPPHTPPIYHSNKTNFPSTTLPPPENPQFSVPTSLWPPTSSPSITLQPQFQQHFNPIQTSYPTITAISTYTQPSRQQYPYPQTPYQQPNYYPQPYYPQHQWSRPQSTQPETYTLDYQTPNQHLNPHPHTIPHQNNGHNPQFQHEHQGDRGNFTQAFSKDLKIEFPKFDGDNPIGWLRQAEKCFNLAATPLDQRVHLAEIFLIGKPDHWLRSTGINTADLSWHEFAAMINNRFASETSMELIDSFKHTEQNSTVNSYIDNFEELMGKIKVRNPSLTEDYFIECFVSGLKDHIKIPLRSHAPVSLV
jgi:hypothetical protein